MNAEQIKPGYKRTEVGVIPEGWIIYSLDQICSKITDGTHDTPTPVSSGRPFLTAIHIKENLIDHENCLYLTEKDHRSIYARCNPQRNDVLMVNIGAGVATTAIIDVDFEFSLKNVALLKPNSERVTGQFLNYTLINKKQSIIKLLSSGGAQPFLSLSQIGAIKVAVPSYFEEIAITRILFEIDSLLSKIDQLIAKKRGIKQAAIQRFFTQKVSLPGFSGSWQSVRIRDLCSYVTGDVTSGGDLGYLEIGDINVESKTYDLGMKEKLSVPGSVKVPKGTLLISTVRPTRGAITVTKTSLHVSSAFCRLRPVTDILYHLVCGQEFLAYLGDNSIGGTYPTCRDETILDYEVTLPVDIEEQTAIAAVLSEMDAELAALEARRDKTRALKQGMMQELLTGRIRLV